MEKRSLGMIETLGYVPAVEAADAGTKAADVKLVGYERARGGLITVKFLGDVAAVMASVSAGKAAASKVGKVVAVHVIPRPDRQIPITPDERPPPPGDGNTVQARETVHEAESPQMEAPLEKRVVSRLKKPQKAEPIRPDAKVRKEEASLPKPKKGKGKKT